MRRQTESFSVTASRVRPWLRGVTRCLFISHDQRCSRSDSSRHHAHAHFEGPQQLATRLCPACANGVNIQLFACSAASGDDSFAERLAAGLAQNSQGLETVRNALNPTAPAARRRVTRA